ncbi:MAG: hypothetical protein FI729_02495 [SAR202 cluster bacterium]|nr:hypothetical protein [SAR202 cluster bacterium]
MPKKYEREIEELLTNKSDSNTDNKHSTVIQLAKLINNRLSQIGSLTGSLLSHPRNRLLTVLLSTVSLIVLTTMLSGIFSSVLWIVLIILIMKFGLNLPDRTSPYERRWRGRIIESEPKENFISKFTKKFNTWNKP